MSIAAAVVAVVYSLPQFKVGKLLTMTGSNLRARLRRKHSGLTAQSSLDEESSEPNDATEKDTQR